MADDNDDWFAGGDDEPEPAPVVAAAAAPAAAATAEAAPAAAEAAPAAAAAGGETREVAEDEFLDPDKLILFKHWIRPKFLQYKYLYDYRQNYYDDVLEVLESRRKGIRREIPRAQTWAERVLRSHSHPLYKVEAFDRTLEDTKLVTRSRISGIMHSHYLKESFTRSSSRLAIL